MTLMMPLRWMVMVQIIGLMMNFQKVQVMKMPEAISESIHSYFSVR